VEKLIEKALAGVYVLATERRGNRGRKILWRISCGERG
jgi:hypothetical protein